jgi:Domain of unknown function (DUF4399)
MRRLITGAAVVAALAAFLGAAAAQQSSQAPAAAARTPAPPDAYLYIGWPNDGQTLKAGRIKVWFGARNIGVAPAGITTPKTGHHHLLINVPVPPLGEPIPNDKNHLHFGAGQTETVLDLPPGTYTLQLLMGDADHVPHNPPVVSKRITIQVR